MSAISPEFMVWVDNETLTHVPPSKLAKSEGIYIRKEFADIIRKDKRINESSGNVQAMVANK